jgi:hypothetical protein
LELDLAGAVGPETELVVGSEPEVVDDVASLSRMVRPLCTQSARVIKRATDLADLADLGDCDVHVAVNQET